MPLRSRVEFEAPPDELDLVAVLEAAERRLEPTLSDVAPWANDIRPDFDQHADTVEKRKQLAEPVGANRRRGRRPTRRRADASAADGPLLRCPRLDVPVRHLWL